MVQNIKFKNWTSNFLERLSVGVRNIKKKPKLLIPPEKTNNLYQITSDEYNKLRTENIRFLVKYIHIFTIYTYTSVCLSI